MAQTGEKGDELRFFLEKFSDEELADIRKLATTIIQERSNDVSIPLSIFSSGLECVEAMTKYLKENLNLGYTEISKLIGSKPSVVYINYQRASGKVKKRFTLKKDDVFLLLKDITNPKLSLLENITFYLRNNNHSNRQIAAIMATTEPVTSASYRRALSKLEVSNGKN
jgi:hypothetical protein